MNRRSKLPVAVGAMPDDPANVTRAIIERLISEGKSHIESAADIAGTSVRTLQRRLAEAGVSYSDLVDEVRLATALALIDDRSIKLSEIARRLGYADAANFDRAFKRWTGFSPSQVRTFDRRTRMDLTKVKTAGSVPPRGSTRK